MRGRAVTSLICLDIEAAQCPAIFGSADDNRVIECKAFPLLEYRFLYHPHYSLTTFSRLLV